MPISEVQSVTVDAAGGTYKLRTKGFGTKAGFHYDPAAPYIARDETFALLTLDFDADAEEVAARLTTLYGFPAGSVTVEKTVTATGVAYRITFGGEVSGRNMPQLEWAETAFTSGLIPAPDQTWPEVRTATLKQGHTVNNAQTITVNATGGTFDLTILGQTVTVPYDATADELRRLLNPVLNPNGSNIDDLDLESALPYTDNVAVYQYGDDYVIVFQGEYTFLKIKAEDIDTTDLDGTVKLATRVNGINYYTIETLNIGLGSGEEVFNIRGTSAVTNLDTHDGDEQIYVSSTADLKLGDYIEFLPGDLNDLRGTLNLYAGSGRHKLMISDEAALVGDTNVLITDVWSAAAGRDKDVAPNAEIFIVGLATSQVAGSITYRADNANFADGITMWTGYGDDTITIDGTHLRSGLRTITTLNTGLGDDTVTVDLQVGEDDFFVLNTQGPYSHVLELETDISAGDHKTPADDVTVLIDGVQLDRKLYNVDYARDLVTLAVNAEPYLGSTVEVHIASGSAVPGATPATETFTLPAMPPTYSDKDTVYGSTSSVPLIIFGGQDDDMIYGGTGNDIIFGDRGRVVYFDETDGASAVIDGNTLTPAALAALETSAKQVLGHGDWGDKTDGVIRPANLLVAVDPTVGGNDKIEAGPAQDVVFGGQGTDRVSAGRGHDVVLGDNGSLSSPLGVARRIETIARTIGGADTIVGGPDDDILVGGAGGDIVDGDAIFDPMASLPEAVTTYSTTNMDLIFGDNVLLTRPDVGDFRNPRFRVLGTSGLLYDALSGEVAINLVDQYMNPLKTPMWAAWRITLLDHSFTDQTQAENDFGDDYIAGGPDDDVIFGQLGNDTIQGDGSINGKTANTAVEAWRITGTGTAADGTLHVVASFEAATDGDDYIEGNGGNDTIFGGLGQDDIMGGNSTLFSLTTYEQRPDGADIIFGGVGTRIDRLQVLTDANRGAIVMVDRHARDADAIGGDNGNIYRLVKSTARPTI
jgi:Ca2+-binding RTX toxin-like protein